MNEGGGGGNEKEEGVDERVVFFANKNFAPNGGQYAVVVGDTPSVTLGGGHCNMVCIEMREAGRDSVGYCAR